MIQKTHLMPRVDAARRMRCFALILIVSIWTTQAHAFDKQGYFRTDFDYSHIRKESVIVRLSGKNPEHLSGLLEGNTELSHTFFGMLRLYTDTSLFFNTIEDHVQLRLNEILIQLTPNQYIDFWLGKRRIVYSPGLAFTPSDVLNPLKDPTDPTLQREGRFGAGISLPFDFMTVSFVWAPYEKDTDYGLPSTFDFTRNTYVGRLYFNLWESDINVIYANREKNNYGGLTFSRYLIDSLELHFDITLQQNRKVPMADALSKETKGLPIPIEPPRFNATGIFVKALIGLRYDFFESHGILTLEYYFNGAGLSRNEFHRLYTYLDTLTSFKEKAASMGMTAQEMDVQRLTTDMLSEGLPARNHLILSFQYNELFDYWNPSITAVWSMDDGSFLLYPRIGYRIYDGVILELGATIPLGHKSTEFGMMPYHVTGIGRIWVYY